MTPVSGETDQQGRFVASIPGVTGPRDVTVKVFYVPNELPAYTTEDPQTPGGGLPGGS